MSKARTYTIEVTETLNHGIIVRALVHKDYRGDGVMPAIRS